MSSKSPPSSSNTAPPKDEDSRSFEPRSSTPNRDETSPDDSSSSSSGPSSTSSLRTLLKSVVPEGVKRAINQGVDSLSEEGLRDTLALDILRRAMDKGTEVVDHTEGSVRRVIQHLPSEAVDRIIGKLDDYKDEGVEMVRGELRRFLDRVDIQREIQSILSQFSVEVKTEISFVPHDEATLGMKPEVKTQAKVKRTTKTKPKAKTKAKAKSARSESRKGEDTPSRSTSKVE
jgi:hypothetical protein